MVNNTLLMLRVISAASVIGWSISYTISDSYKIWILPLSLAIAASLLVAGDSKFALLSYEHAVFNLSVGVLIGVVLSTPVIAIDFFSASLRSCFLLGTCNHVRKGNFLPFKILSSLILLLALFEMDFLTHCFMQIARSNSYLPTEPNWNFISLKEPAFDIVNYSRALFAATLFFCLPSFFAMFSMYLLFIFLQIAAPPVLSMGFTTATKITFALLAIFICNSLCSSYFYDLTSTFTQEFLK